MSENPARIQGEAMGVSTTPRILKPKKNRINALIL